MKSNGSFPASQKRREIENASGVGTVGNAKCGDIMRIYLDIDDNGIIKDYKFKTFGCGAAVATSSMATEMVMGKSIQEALQVTNKAVMEGRTSSCKGSLLPSRRGSHPCGSLGLCRETRHQNRRLEETQVRHSRG